VDPAHAAAAAAYTAEVRAGLQPYCCDNSGYCNLLDAREGAKEGASGEWERVGGAGGDIGVLGSGQAQRHAQL
jgi:hypothetical protein